MEISELKTRFKACQEGIDFAASKSSLLEAWYACEQGTWMLWFAQKLDCPIRILTLAKGLCAETVIHLMKNQISINAVQVAINYGNGVVGHEEVEKIFFDIVDNTDAPLCSERHANVTARFAVDMKANAQSVAMWSQTAIKSKIFEEISSSPFDKEASEISLFKSKINQKQTAHICREVLTDFIKTKI